MSSRDSWTSRRLASGAMCLAGFTRFHPPVRYWAAPSLYSVLYITAFSWPSVRFRAWWWGCIRAAQLIRTCTSSILQVLLDYPMAFGALAWEASQVSAHPGNQAALCRLLGAFRFVLCVASGPSFGVYEGNRPGYPASVQPELSEPGYCSAPRLLPVTSASCPDAGRSAMSRTALLQSMKRT